MASILIADDDEVFGRTLEQFFTALGHRPYRVLDANALSVAIAKRRFDLLVLDVQMPGGGAPAALRRVAAEKGAASVPILAISGMPVDRMREWFPDRPDVRFFRKPVAFPELRAAVEAILGPSSPPAAAG